MVIKLENGWTLFLLGMKELRSPDRGGFYSEYFFSAITEITGQIVAGTDLQGYEVVVELE